MPGPARAFTVDAVVAAAMRCLDDVGFDRLSIRATATALGVTPNALYTYVADRTTLLHLLQEAALGAVAAPLDTGRLPRERLTTLADRMWSAFAATPNRVHLLIAAPLSGPNALAISEQLLRAFLDDGHSRTEAARASYAFQVQVIGFLLLRSADDEVPHPDPLAAAAPLTASAADVAATYGSREQYDWNVSRVLDGLLATTPVSTEDRREERAGATDPEYATPTTG